MVELGSCTGDMTWATLSLVGLAFIVDNGPARIRTWHLRWPAPPFLAYNGFMEARKGTLPEGEVRYDHSDSITGALISLGNPFQIAF
jgi:threonine/homoserine/homoserine lactone efflux protein